MRKTITVILLVLLTPVMLIAAALGTGSFLVAISNQLKPVAAQVATAPGTVPGAAPRTGPEKTSQGGSAPFAFMETFNVSGGKVPVRWPSCTTLTLIVDTRGIPADGPAQVSYAAKRLAQATGMNVTVEYSANPQSASGGRIPIHWLDSSSGKCQDAEAVACTLVATLAQRGRTHIISAELNIYVDEAGDDLRDVLLHELGHAVGLDHVKSAGQVMYPRVTKAAAYAAGDLAGLKVAGQEPC